MRQAVIVAPDRFELREAPRPMLISESEVLLRTIACGICSGDLMPWYLAKKVGTVLGHEPVGIAEEVGSRVKHIRRGDLVFVHHHAPCLNCAECLRGAPVHCATWKRSHLDPGGMAEWIRAAPDLVKGDAFAVNDLHPEQALFIEPVGCCVKAFTRIGGPPAVERKRIAVIGCGIMGLLNIQTALAFGAKEVVAVEPDAGRREKSRESGAVSAMTPEEAGRSLNREMDIVVIGPGHPAVIRQALSYVRNAGIACLFTPTATGVTTELDLGDLYFREISLTPSYSCGPADTRRAYELIRGNQVRPREMITHRFPLDEVQTAFDTALAGGPAIKVIVTMDSSVASVGG